MWPNPNVAHTFSGPKAANKTGTLHREDKGVVIHLVVWLLFGVILGLLPFIAIIIKDAMFNNVFSLIKILGGGELFITSAVISGGAMGELFAGALGVPRLLRILAGFSTLMACIANTMAYMAVSTAPQSNVMYLSLVFFPFTLLASGFSIGTAVVGR